MMMMEKISAIQRKHANITRPGKIRWEEMSMAMSRSIVKLISMKIKDKKIIITNTNLTYLPNLGELPLSPSPLSLPLSLYQPTELN